MINGEDEDRSVSDAEDMSDTDTDSIGWDGHMNNTDIVDQVDELLSKTPTSVPLLKCLHDRNLGRPDEVSDTADETILSKMKVTKELKGHCGSVNSFDFSRCGQRLISGSNDRSLILWDLEKGREVLRIYGCHKSNIFE